jgi:RNA polymerase sigma factor (sigma-70 family)
MVISTTTELCCVAEKSTLIELVKRAQQGCKNSMDELVRDVQQKVRAYVYRHTQDHDLTQDLSQEILLQMVKSLDCLRKAESFWPWLYRIAQNKIRRYFKSKGRETSVFESAIYRSLLSRDSHHHRGDGLRRLIQKELTKKMLAAMRKINDDYRVVLSLRCFEERSYSDIGMALNCSEDSARVTFYRAKQALRAGISECLL